jgi:hypothetical protein
MNVTGADSPNIATCINVGVFEQALTYGDQYAILARDTEKRQVKVRGDNGRTRWYPDYCFDVSGQPVVRVVRTAIADPIDDPVTCTVDVVLEFSDGQRRLCDFTTPEALSQRGGVAQFGGVRLLSYSPHMIVVSAITPEMIAQSVAYIESHGDIFNCSKPLD